MSFTPFQAEVTRIRAIVDLSEGKSDSPAIKFCRDYLDLVASGRMVDPLVPRDPTPKPMVPVQRKPLTNDILDGRERPERVSGPVPGSKAWFAARRRAKEAA